jgi:hypothetical protein
MRDGDLEYFTKGQAAAEGWTEFDHNKYVDPKDWDVIADIIQDWVWSNVGDGFQDMEIDFVVHINYRELVDANEIQAEEDACKVPDDLPYIPLG